MDELKRQAGLDPRGGAPGPAEQQIPGAQAEVLGDEQPQAQGGAADLIGQELSDAALEAAGVARLGAALRAGALGLDGGIRIGLAAIEFFFEGRNRR